jgi:hypothetical protein
VLPSGVLTSTPPAASAFACDSKLSSSSACDGQPPPLAVGLMSSTVVVSLDAPALATASLNLGGCVDMEPRTNLRGCGAEAEAEKEAGRGGGELGGGWQVSDTARRALATGQAYMAGSLSDSLSGRRGQHAITQHQRSHTETGARAPQ